MIMKASYAVIAAFLYLVCLPNLSLADVQHVVVRGDTLYSISQKYNLSVGKLKSSNRLKSEKLRIGDKLRIPEKVAASASSRQLKKKSSLLAKSRIPARPMPSLELYKVRKGDTLHAIARNYGISVNELKKLNGMKRNGLKAGSQLKVPATGAESEMVAESEKRDLQPASQATSKDDAVNDEQPAVVADIKGDEPISNEDPPEEGKELDPTDPSQKDALLKVASKYLGVPYKFGGSSIQNGIDCSAFVQKVFGFLSVDLPRTAREQFRTGQKIAKRDLKEGDLVFFKTYARYASHVGIYIGDNKFIHASSRGKKVSISNLDEPYYTKRFIGAKRVEVEKSL